MFVGSQQLIAAYPVWLNHLLDKSLIQPIWIVMLLTVSYRYLDLLSLKKPELLSFGHFWAICFKENMVNVLKFLTLVACQKGLDKQRRPRSDQGLPCFLS